MTTVLSFSSYQRYKRCPLWFKKANIERLPVREPDYTGALPGNVLHKVAEPFFKAPESKRNPKDFFFGDPFDNTLKSFMNSSSVHFGKDYRFETRDEALEFIDKCRSNFIDMILHHKLHVGKNVVEGQFGTWNKPLDIDGLLVSGSFDLLNTNAIGVSRLVDFKASLTPFHLDRDQLILYQMAVKKMLGITPAMVGYILFYMRKALWYRITADMEEHLHNTMTYAVKKIEEGCLPPQPSKATCKICDYWNQCESSQSWAAKIAPSTEIVVEEDIAEL